MSSVSWKEVGIRVLMVVAGVLFSLVCTELVLRWMGYNHPEWQFANNKIIPTTGFPTANHYTYDPITGFSLVPNIQDTDRKITTDENGFRVTARPYDRTKPSVILVGDSTVFGYLSQDVDTFPYIVSTMPEFAGYNIINMGVPAYSLAHITQVIKHKVPQYNPKLIFVQILWPWKPFESYASSPNAWKEVDFAFYKTGFKIRTKFEKPSDELGLAMPVFIEDLWRKINFGKQIRENFSRPTDIRDFQVSEEFESSLAWEHVQGLREAARSLDGLGVKVVFYIHPFQYTLYRDEYKNWGIVGRRILMDQLDAIYLGDCILESSAHQPGELLFIDYAHMTKAGNTVLAQCFRQMMSNYLKP